MTRDCAHCGESFTPATSGRGKSRRYCSENCRKRFCENRKRATCLDCDTELGLGSAWRNRVRCQACEATRKRAGRDARWHQIEKWWAEGLTFPEICARLGWAKGTLGSQLHRMREAGFDVPYRYKPGKRNSTRFPDQVPT